MGSTVTRPFTSWRVDERGPSVSPGRHGQGGRRGMSLQSLAVTNRTKSAPLDGMDFLLRLLVKQSGRSSTKNISYKYHVSNVSRKSLRGPEVEGRVDGKRVSSLVCIAPHAKTHAKTPRPPARELSCPVPAPCRSMAHAAIFQPRRDIRCPGEREDLLRRATSSS